MVASTLAKATRSSSLRVRTRTGKVSPRVVKRRLGRSELKPFSNWNDGRPETELNFKFYRQATNKIIGISNEAAALLRRFL